MQPYFLLAEVSTTSSPVREREKEREIKRGRGKERERERKKERNRERQRQRQKGRVFIFKRNDGCLIKNNCIKFINSLINKSSELLPQSLFFAKF